jgi:hypothetical protein
MLYLLKQKVDMALPLVLAGAGVAAKAYNMYQANQREKQALKSLRDLAKTPYAKYSVNPLVQRYTQMGLRDIQNPQGFSGAEVGQFNQGIGQQANALRANALSVGGSSVGRAVNLMNNANQVNALNQFAGQNAALMRQNRNLGFSRYMQGAGVAQGIDNMNIGNELQRRMMTEQALGAAARQNRDIVSQGIEGIGSDLLGAGLNMGMSNGFISGGSGGSMINSNNLMQEQLNANKKGFYNIPKIAPDRGIRVGYGRYNRMMPLTTLDYNQQTV